jgi:ABC-type branched-subunit amino acid transport system ATPase component
MDVDAGEIRGLIGPNGSGKSTTLNLIGGLLRHDQGNIELAGRRVDQLPPHQRAAHGIGHVFQSPTLFGELSAIDNVRVGLHLTHPEGRGFFTSVFRPLACRRNDLVSRQEAMRHLDAIGLGHTADLRAGDLSYGEQRLLDIAKAMAAMPKVLLLDEPAAGLGKTMVEHLVSVVRRLREAGTTIVITDHNLEMIMGLCDRITVLNYGRKLVEGEPQQVRKDEAVIAAYIGKRH